MRLTSLEPETWRVLLMGKAVDTELLVRLLVAWRGGGSGWGL
jgi:hypothetical protein